MVKRTKLKTVADFLRWEPIMAKDNRDAFAALPRPSKVLGVAIPSSLGGLTFEELTRFWSVTTTDELVATIADVILHVKPRKLLKADVLEAVGLLTWIVAELQHVSELWNSIPNNHTPEEIMAGCNSLNFGVFGIADWYARRMGLTNHDEAMRTPWVRVWQCMKNDAEEQAYQRRLSNIINQRTHK